MSGSHVDDGVRAAAAVIDRADALLITCGAGMGVESGLPTFRGPEAARFSQAWPGFGRVGARYEELSSPAIFDVDPHLAWGFHGACLKMYRSVRPHEGFAVLRRLAEGKPGGCFVYTSNIDGQFRKAGFCDAGVMECHGSALRLQCTGPCGDHTWPAGEIVCIHPKTGVALDPLPQCPACRAVARPNVRMFADAQWIGRPTAAESARFEMWKRRLVGRAVAVVECGAGTSVPAARLASDWAVLQLRATLIRINPRESEVPVGHVGVPLPAAVALTAIETLVRERGKTNSEYSGRNRPTVPVPVTP